MTPQRTRPSSALPARALLTLTAVLALAPACRSTGARSPEALRDAYAQALRKDDPDAAYALLSPELQARNTLLFHYGPERTAAILAGRDEATNADLAAWRRLGTGARA